MNRKIKHTKIKNVLILFEVLARKITTDIIEGKDNNTSVKLLKTYFNKNTELRKELDLYRLLMNTKFNNEVKCSSFIDIIMETRKTLNNNKLKKEKYNIIKDIKDNFDSIDNLFSVKFENYSTMASIYKLFEYNSLLNETKNPDDLIKSKFNVVDFMMKNSNKQNVNKDNILENFKSENKEVRLLTNKILIDKYNNKYTNKLNTKQKELVKEYINNISESNSLKTFIDNSIPTIIKNINSLCKKIDNNAIIIKLNEINNMLTKLKTKKNITDENVVSLLKTYELIDEIKKHQCNKKII